MPKTKAGLRTVPLGEGVLPYSRHGGRNPPTRKATTSYSNQIGTYQNRDDMVKRRFLPLFDLLQIRWLEERRNDVVEVFNWHALRHFAISCWIEASLQPKTVQIFAGHSSLQVTMDRDGHLFRSDDHGRAMDAIAGVFFRPQPSRSPAVQTHQNPNSLNN